MNIEINNLSKKFGQRWVLKNASLCLSPGKITILLGANGAGKSSLMRTAIGLLAPDQGSIIYEGQNLYELQKPSLAKLVGYLAQNAKPEWNMRTQDLIALGRIPLQELGLTNLAKDTEIVQKIMNKIGIERLFDQNVHEISGGELALCLLARVLAGEPKFIFADEPFNHLDIKHQFELVRALKDYAKNGGGALIIVHDIALAARFGDEFILMKDAEIIAKGTREEALKDENLFKAYGTKLSLREIENQFVLIAQ